MKNYNNQKKNIFNEEEIKTFVDFYQLLQRIHNRLIREGYVIKDGKISKPESDIDCGEIVLKKNYFTSEDKSVRV